MPEPNEQESSKSISLSEALLAPLNAIFEAQIHASRAFLSFFLQMGFRHKYTPEDMARLEADKETNSDILREIADQKDRQKDIETLTKQKVELEAKDQLTLQEAKELERILQELKDLNIRWGTLFQQPIEYVDQNGNGRTIFIPNLALLPIKPLAISSANFKFELKVKDEMRTADSPIRSSAKALQKRPWFLIDTPKTIEGEFAMQQKENSSEKTIKIEVTVGSVDTPYGLHKLISSLTNLAGDSANAKI